jgi:hypothetical protein
MVCSLKNGAVITTARTCSSLRSPRDPSRSRGSKGPQSHRHTREHLPTTETHCATSVVIHTCPARDSTLARELLPQRQRGADQVAFGSTAINPRTLMTV